MILVVRLNPETVVGALLLESSLHVYPDPDFQLYDHILRRLQVLCSSLQIYPDLIKW
jgi:hypothetical protein